MKGNALIICGTKPFLKATPKKAMNIFHKSKYFKGLLVSEEVYQSHWDVSREIEAFLTEDEYNNVPLLELDDKLCEYVDSILAHTMQIGNNLHLEKKYIMNLFSVQEFCNSLYKKEQKEVCRETIPKTHAKVKEARRRLFERSDYSR